MKLRSDNLTGIQTVLDEFMAAVAQTLGQPGALAALAALVEAGEGVSESDSTALTEDERVAADKRRYSRISKVGA